MSILSVWIDILLPKTKPIFIGSVYRTPKQDDLLDNLESQLQRIDLDHECYILGNLKICMKNKKIVTQQGLSIVNFQLWMQPNNRPTNTNW